MVEEGGGKTQSCVIWKRRRVTNVIGELSANFIEICESKTLEKLETRRIWETNCVLAVKNKKRKTVWCTVDPHVRPLALVGR